MSEYSLVGLALSTPGNWHWCPATVGNLGGRDRPNREVNELIPRLGSPLSAGSHVRNAPRMAAIPAGLGTVVVGPIRPAPCPTWRRQQDDVEVAVLDPRQPGLLLLLVQKVVLRAADEHVHGIINPPARRTSCTKWRGGPSAQTEHAAPRRSSGCAATWGGGAAA